MAMHDVNSWRAGRRAYRNFVPFLQFLCRSKVIQNKRLNTSRFLGVYRFIFYTVIFDLSISGKYYTTFSRRWLLSSLID